MLERLKRPKRRGHLKIRKLPADYLSPPQKNPRVWGRRPGDGGEGRWAENSFKFLPRLVIPAAHCQSRAKYQLNRDYNHGVAKLDCFLAHNRNLRGVGKRQRMGGCRNGAALCLPGCARQRTHARPLNSVRKPDYRARPPEPSI
jgi:hypothetical protein